MPQDNPPPQKGERIAKVMAAAGLCSRRMAEQWILDGKVSVDGVILTTPAFLVTESSRILVNGHPLRRSERITRLWLYHKPAGLIVTNHDPQGRPTIYDQLPKSMPRVVSVGRLDFNSEGLLLLTNDGGLSRFLELPKNAAKRVYRVRVYGELPPDLSEKLAAGVVVGGIAYASAIVEIDKVTGRNAWLYITLTEGKNREIRKLMEHFDLQVNRLIRQSYGPFELADLQPGKLTELPHAVLQRALPEYFGPQKSAPTPRVGENNSAQKSKFKKRPSRPFDPSQKRDGKNQPFKGSAPKKFGKKPDGLRGKNQPQKFKPKSRKQ